MKNYKVCVYAICKNEEKFVERWVKSMSEADKIIVLDTGSTDNTVNLLKDLGVEVYEKKFASWRFDEARNYSLSLVPDEYEICVCTDLDEVFDPGWKELVVNAWDEFTTRLRYLYNWSFNEYGEPETIYYLNKIHKNGLYTWTHPVHEVLTCLGVEKEKLVEKVTLNHYPDRNKSRSNYLPLLELSVKESPLDDRNMHYLGREYMYYSRWEECIETLKKHLELKSATWKDERCASMRFIARSYNALNNKDEAISWYKKAILEAPYLREGYVELAYLYYDKKDYEESYKLLKEAFKITDKSKSYINEAFAWNSFIYDLMSICAFNLGYYDEALYYVKKAIEKDKNNLRLLMNLEEMEKYVN